MAETRRAFIFSHLSLFLLLLLHRLPPSSASANHSNKLTKHFLRCLSTFPSNSSVPISSILYSKSNPSYPSVLHSYIRNGLFNTTSTPKPALIVTPLHESHVSAAVKCSADHSILLKVRSGGHDYEGLSYVSNETFVILDMGNLRSIAVDINDESAWVQAGATLGEIYYRIWEKSKVHAFPAGVCPTVAAGGHITGGGYGNLLRSFGLSVDNLVDALIVDVGGRILDRKSMGEDLFWAIRGGGGASFAVILSYKLKLVRVPETVTYFRIERRVDEEENATESVSKWQKFAPKTDARLFVRLLLQPVTSRVNKSAKTIRATFIGESLSKAQTVVSLIDKDFPEMGLKPEDCKEMTWIESVLYWTNFDNGSTPLEVLLDRNQGGTASPLKRKSDYVQTPIPRKGLESLWKEMVKGKTGLVFNPYGGRMDEIPATATAFPHRAGNLYKIQYSANWSEEGEEDDAKYVSQIRGLYSFMEPFVSKNPRGAFLNYRDLDIGVNDHGSKSYEQSKSYGEKYFMQNFQRLVEVKTKVDPNNFFWNEQGIVPFPSKP